MAVQSLITNRRMALIRRTLGLFWATSAPLTLAVVLITVAEGLTPAAMMWLARNIVNGLIQSMAQGATTATSLIELIGPFAALVALGQGLAALGSVVIGILQARLLFRVQDLIIERASELDVQYFEDSSFHDQLQNAREEAGYRPVQLVQGALATLQSLGTLLAVGGLLLSVTSIGTLAIVLGFIPLLWVRIRYGRSTFLVRLRRTAETRRMAYLAHLLTSDAAVKELRLFNLAPLFIERHRRLAERFLAEDRHLIVRREALSLLAIVIAALPVGGASLALVLSVLNGQRTLGDLVLFAQGLMMLQQRLPSLMVSLGALYESMLFLSNLFGFLDLRPQAAGRTGQAPLDRPIRAGIVFDRVTFTYPGSPDATLRDVSLEIPAGTVVALVGENGAGKTTLIKLLGRLYEPDSGAIRLDNRPLADYDTSDLRSQLSFVFQDFVRYQAPARENIGYGNAECLEDLLSIRAAAQRAGADGIIEGLANGYETMLGKWFQDGQELSVGQWQTLALARAFCRDAQILVLDEPTASMDARAEHEFFQRFHAYARGRTVILISHRLSTVQFADQIIVLEHGRIVERGTHSDLLAQTGIYASLFNRQAALYR